MRAVHLNSALLRKVRHASIPAGPTSEWDTAAGHAILEAAGGQVTTSDGDAFLYRKRNFKNSSFIAWGGIKPT